MPDPVAPHTLHIFMVLSQHPLARGGIPAVEQPDAVKVVQEKR